MKDELGFKKGSQIAKFQRAIRSLPQISKVAVQPIFLGKEEKEIMEKIYAKYETLCTENEMIQKSVNEINKTAMSATKEIHSCFDSLISMMEKRRKILLNDVQKLKQERINELEEALVVIKKMKNKSLQNKQKYQTSLIYNYIFNI